MAHPTEKPKKLAELIRQAEESRHALTESHARLMRKFDIPARVKTAITGSPSKWLGGALLAGVGTSFLFRPGKRKAAEHAKKTKKQRGFFLGMLALLFTLSKPAMKIYATKLLKDYLSQRFESGAQARPVASRTSPY